MKQQQDSESPWKTSSPIFVSSNNHNRCGFNLIPCSDHSPSSSPSLWHKIRRGETENRWWALPVRALKKLREWSERIGGPKWKTFIRRFDCSRGVSCAGGVIATGTNKDSHGVDEANFQYDALNYELNFDDGHNGLGDEDDCHYPDFTSRYAVAGGALSTKHLMSSSREVNPVGS